MSSSIGEAFRRRRYFSIRGKRNRLLLLLRSWLRSSSAHYVYFLSLISWPESHSASSAAQSNTYHRYQLPLAYRFDV